MKLVESNYNVEGSGKALKDIISAFYNSKHNQVEVLDWEEYFSDVYTARSVATRIIANDFTGHIVATVSRKRLFLYKI